MDYLLTHYPFNTLALIPFPCFSVLECISPETVVNCAGGGGRRGKSLALVRAMVGGLQLNHWS